MRCPEMLSPRSAGSGVDQVHLLPAFLGENAICYREMPMIPFFTSAPSTSSEQASALREIPG